MNRICGNCGADEALHHYDTQQCPKNGVEEWREGKKQIWVETKFVDAQQMKLERAAPQLLNALLAVKRHGLIEKDGYDTVVKMVGDAIEACE